MIHFEIQRSVVSWSQTCILSAWYDFPPHMVRNMRGVEKIRVSYSVTLVSTGMTASVKLCQHGGFVTNNYELIRNNTTRSPESVGELLKMINFFQLCENVYFFQLSDNIGAVISRLFGFCNFLKHGFPPNIWIILQKSYENNQ